MELSLVKKVRKKKGFTLIELIVVIAIIAILAALAIPRLMGVQQDAKIKSDIANAKTIADATAALIAQGKIDGNSTVTITLDSNTDSTPAAAKTALTNYLQTVPTPQAVSNKPFIITATPASGSTPASIVVTVNGTQVYPSPDPNYGK